MIHLRQNEVIAVLCGTCVSNDITCNVTLWNITVCLICNNPALPSNFDKHRNAVVHSPSNARTAAGTPSRRVSRGVPWVGPSGDTRGAVSDWGHVYT